DGDRRPPLLQLHQRIRGTDRRHVGTRVAGHARGDGRGDGRALGAGVPGLGRQVGGDGGDGGDGGGRRFHGFRRRGRHGTVEGGGGHGALLSQRSGDAAR